MIYNFSDFIKNYPKNKVCLGGTAKFYKINDEVGLKVFHSKFKRDVSYDNQKKLNELSLAPKIFEKFDIHDDFALTTELVRPLFDCFDDIDENLFEQQEKFYSEQVQKFNNKCEELGVRLLDNHIGNLAFDKNNNIIIIDTESIKWL
jgi:hypothetical protein